MSNCIVCVQFNTDDHYYIADRSTHTEDITEWLNQNADDPAFENWLDIFFEYLATSLRFLEDSNGTQSIDISEEDRRCVLIQNNTVHFHPRARINWTSYDVRRHQDIISPTLHPDFMVLASGDNSLANSEGSHMTEPYFFGRAIKIGHVVAKLHGQTEWQRVNFVWTRWFGLNSNGRGSWVEKRPPAFSFFDAAQGDAFGFAHLAQIVRGVHMIPAFAWGRTKERLYGPSIARQFYGQGIENGDENSEWEDMDWERYILNIFADRDMLMRFRGGVGHLITRVFDKKLLRESHISPRTHARERRIEKRPLQTLEVEDSLESSTGVESDTDSESTGSNNTGDDRSDGDGDEEAGSAYDGESTDFSDDGDDESDGQEESSEEYFSDDFDDEHLEVEETNETILNREGFGDF